MKVHPVTACPACRAEVSSPVELGSATLRRCESCGLVFAPEYADPSEVYVEGYLFGQTHFGLDVMHPLFQEFLAYAAGVRFGHIERMAGTPPGRLLDVGCGSGEVLAVARERGWDVTGVEPVEQSARFAREKRGLPVIAATLEESGLPERSFDLVTAFHVLEHMSDALAFLQTLARWARPGGHVVVEVPNFRSVHRRRAGDGWAGLRPLEHIGHYSPRTLRAAFVRAGLAPVTIRTIGFLWDDRQALDEQLNDLGLYGWGPRLVRLGAPSPARPDVLAARPLTRRALQAVQWAYDRFGIGQVVLGIGRTTTG